MFYLGQTLPFFLEMVFSKTHQNSNQKSCEKRPKLCLESSITSVTQIQTSYRITGLYKAHK